MGKQRFVPGGSSGAWKEANKPAFLTEVLAATGPACEGLGSDGRPFLACLRGLEVDGGGFDKVSRATLADLAAACWNQRGPAFEADFFSADGGKVTLARGLKSQLNYARGLRFALSSYS